MTAALAAVGFGGTSYEPTWTTQQAADFLGIARKTLYNRSSLGTAPKPRKQGRLNGYIPSEIAAYRRELLGLDNGDTTGTECNALAAGTKREEAA